MKGSIPVWSAILAIWIFGGYFIGNSLNFCDCGAAAVGAAGATGASSYMSGLAIRDDAGMALASTNHNLMFLQSDNAPIVSGEVHKEYRKVADHLRANPEKMLFLTGLYHTDEENKTELANLGLARATALKQFFIDRCGGVASDQIIISSAVHDGDMKLDEKNRLHGHVWYDFISDYLSISDGVDFHQKVEDNFQFDHSAFNYEEPLSDDLDDLFTQAAEYVKGNEHLTLRITGLFADDETNNKEDFENIGLARANAVKKIFMELGLEEDQIIINSSTLDAGKFEDDKIKGGVHLDILGNKVAVKTMTNKSPQSTIKDAASDAVSGVTSAAASAVAVANTATDKVAGVFKTKEALQAETLTLYFTSGNSDIQLTANQENFLQALINYMDDNPDAMLEVIGHTDDRNVSEENANKFGRKRARSVRKYLNKNRGINIEQIRIDSDGSINPIASNDTEEGRAQNRRVEIQLKK